LYAAKNRIASQEGKRGTLQKPKDCTAAENMEAFEAVCNWLDAEKFRMI
jgi:hypothetical protein